MTDLEDGETFDDIKTKTLKIEFLCQVYDKLSIQNIILFLI